ncbi:extracellular solute-binding protein [Vallitalea maricola]|uniref:ABC transporter substrate-binding protein n=1 Tax=Vallitalea maricola TaxID=3074433 RepID=A0ACB5UJF2_9FIRM|nr:ABC transporter substrate-binding protein [Vallitalea sp. AN17-2]
MKKLITTLLITTVIIASIGGCEQAKKKVVKFGAAADYYGETKSVIEQFNGSQDTYEVQLVELDGSNTDAHDKIKTSISRGSSDLDVISMDVTWAGEFAGGGYLEPIDVRMQEKGYKKTDFNEGAMKAGNYEGLQYTLPFYLDLGLLYYRKDIVEETEAKVLESGNYTYTDLSKLAEKYKGQENTETGFVFQSGVYEGLTINVTEFTNSFHTLKRGLETMKMFVDADYTPNDILYYNEKDTNDAFIQGKTVFSRNWPYQSKLVNNEQLELNLKKEQIGIAPLPNGGVIGGYVLGINKNSSNKDGAWEFIRYISSEEGQKTIVIQGQHIPGYNKLLTDADIMDSNELFKSQGYKNALASSIVRPISDKYTTVSDTIQINVHKYLSGAQDLGITIKELEKLITDNKIISKQ